jgi:hypothetical protein
VFRKKSPANYITNISRNDSILFPQSGQKITKALPLFTEAVGDHKIQITASESGQYNIVLKNGESMDLDLTGMAEVNVLKNPWVLKFPSGWGAPDSIIVPELKSWTEFSDPGIKYYSGTATYSSKFTLTDIAMQTDQEYYLDLGTVRDLAEISVNKNNLPVQWKPPFRVNINPYLISGENYLTVRITNLWPNRLIGDQFLPLKERYTFTNIGKFTRESPLLESGLIGPVKILKQRKIVLDLSGH